MSLCGARHPCDRLACWFPAHRLLCEKRPQEQFSVVSSVALHLLALASSRMRRTNPDITTMIPVAMSSFAVISDSVVRHVSAFSCLSQAPWNLRQQRNLSERDMRLLTVVPASPGLTRTPLLRTASRTNLFSKSLCVRSCLPPHECRAQPLILVSVGPDYAADLGLSNSCFRSPSRQCRRTRVVSRIRLVLENLCLS